MTKKAKKRRGFLEVDRTFPGIGRVRATSRTHDKQLRDDMKGMLGAISRMGRVDILEAIRDHVLPLQVVWDRFRQGDLDRVPTVAELRLLAATRDAWITTYRIGPKGISPHHRANLRSCLLAVTAPASEHATLATLPDLLAAYRRKCEGQGHHRAFNLARSAVQAFLRDTLGRRSRLYQEVSASEALPYERPEQAAGIPVHAARELVAALGDTYGAMWWTMARHGMGWKEYHADGWSVEGDRVAIGGKKRRGRRRVVPRIGDDLLDPADGTAYKAFHRACVKHGTTPYAPRRAYAHWLEEAGVPRTRRQMYLGHKARDVTDLYERHEVAAYLAADRAKLSAYLGVPLDGEPVKGGLGLIRGRDAGHSTGRAVKSGGVKS